MEQIVKYDVTEAAVAQMKELYMGLTITDLDNQEEFQAVHDGRMVVKNHRVSVEKKRKELKADALEWGRKVDTEAKRIFALLKPVEDHLAGEEKKVTDEKKRIEAEKEAVEKVQIQTRVDTLFTYGVVMPYFDVAMLSDDDYSKTLETAKTAYNVEQHRLEKERKAKEAEEKKLAEDRAEIERIKEEQEAKAKEQEEKEKALQAEKDKLEANKKAEEDRKNREAFEKKAAEDAKIQAEKDAQAKAEREVKELKEKEEREVAEKARREELKPDKEKLLNWIKTFNQTNFPTPRLESKEACKILEEAMDAFEEILQRVEEQTEEL